LAHPLDGLVVGIARLVALVAAHYSRAANTALLATLLIAVIFRRILVIFKEGIVLM
jgi:hypothetical protein